MATIDGMKVNGSVDQVDRHHENRIFVVRRGLIMFQTLLALLLMGALLMAWPLGRAAAAPGSPEFKSFEKNDIVDDQHITIDKPEGTAEGDLLIGAVVHSDNEVTIDPPAGWSTIDLASCNNDQCTLGVFYLVAGESEPRITHLCSMTLERLLAEFCAIQARTPAIPSTYGTPKTGTPCRPRLPMSRQPSLARQSCASPPWTKTTLQSIIGFQTATLGASSLRRMTTTDPRS